MDTPNVKQKPGTPLPWEEDDEAQICAQNTVVAKTPWGGLVSDARYMVHSANAYPKLVEALAGLTNNLWGTKVIEEGENAVIRHRFVAARDLLRELGEL